jgi:transcriptional regulator with XRE-family HTH domain
LKVKDTSIRHYRKLADISQQKLAKLLNTTQTNISFLEAKLQYPDLKTAEKIAEILGVPVGALWFDYELELIRRKG